MASVREEIRTIMCFGDSNTHGTCAMHHMQDKRRFAIPQRWPGVMAAELGEGWRIVEEGHPGRTTVHDDAIEGEHKNGLRILPALLETHRPIDLVIIMLGTNDFKARFNVSAADVALAVQRLLVTIERAECGPDKMAPQVLLLSPPPLSEIGFLSDMYAGGAVKSQALAGHLGQLAEDRQIAFLDAGLVAAIDPLDGIHLGMEAHEKLGKAVAEAVRSIFE